MVVVASPLGVQSLALEMYVVLSGLESIYLVSEMPWIKGKRIRAITLAVTENYGGISRNTAVKPLRL